MVTAAWLIGLAGPAAAHPALVSSSPGAGYAVTGPPRSISLTFSEPVTLLDRALVLRDAAGRERSLALTQDGGGATVVGTPVQPPPVGAYQVSYRVVGRDGDTIEGSFGFGVATPVGAVGATAAGGAADTGPDAVTTVLRTLLFLGVAVALGGAYLAWRVGVATGGLPGVRPLVRSGSAVALAAALGLLLQIGPATRLLTTASAPGVGRLIGTQAALLLLAAVAARRPFGGSLAVVGLVGVAVLEGIRAHPDQAAGTPGAALTAAHLLAAAVWLGGLLHVLRLVRAWRERRKAVRAAVETYARNALAAVVLVSVTGVASALMLLPSAADWTGSGFGRLMLVKLVLFAAVLVLAVVGRARLRRPATGTAAARQAAPRLLGRPAVVETALLAAVVLAAATVTTVTPPRLVPVAALLAAPVGPTLRTAERASQITVSIVASQGRVELRAFPPDDGRPPAVRLTARRGASALPLSSCGPTCWTAPVQWSPGVNALQVDVRAERFTGGRVTLPVSWPPEPAPELLARVQQAMGARSAIDTVEQVTSGFGPVAPNRSRRTGQEFLAAQSWADGGGTDAVLVRGPDGSRTLLFALPALGYHFAMRLDDADRIVSERIVTPNHVLTRAYVYP